jgi:serine/threonine protein kinase
LLFTNQGQVKLVDFGLAQQFNMRQTERGTLLGTLEFMAPEQSEDASSVGIGADIYGLGASLFFLLTGQAPYPQARTVYQALQNLQNNPPRLVRTLRPETPPELEAFISTLLHRQPTHRPALPLTVHRALAPFACSARSAVVRPSWGQKPALSDVPTAIPVQ